MSSRIQPHEHGFGKFRRTAWGAKEDCEQCMSADKLMAEVREDFKVNYAPLLETTVVDADGIIRDVPMFKGEPIKVTEQLYDGSYEAYVGDPDPEGYLRASGSTPAEAIHNFLDLWDDEEDQAVNSVIAKDERPSSVSFAPTDRQIAVFLLFFFLCLGLSIDTVMKGDLAAVRFHQEAK